MLTSIPYSTITIPSLNVKVANGQTVVSTQIVRSLEWWIEGCTFSVSARMLDLAAFDLILGMYWLELHSPMTCDWLQKKIQFDHQGTLVTLQGILPTETPVLSEISSEQVHKHDSAQEQYLINGIPKEIQQVIHVNSDMFAIPTSLPPNRAFYHAI
jgi:hypothetical protein